MVFKRLKRFKFGYKLSRVQGNGIFQSFIKELVGFTTGWPVYMHPSKWIKIGKY